MKIIVMILIIILVALWILVTYNKFMQLKTVLDNSWQTIIVQLKRRYSLIPAYLELSKPYINNHELITNIIELRSASMGASNIQEKGAAEAELYRALTALDTAIQNNQMMSADEDIQAIRHELNEIETAIQQATQTHNDAATRFNILTETFPTKLIATLAHFERVSYF